MKSWKTRGLSLLLAMGIALSLISCQNETASEGEESSDNSISSSDSAPITATTIEEFLEISEYETVSDAEAESFWKEYLLPATFTLVAGLEKDGDVLYKVPVTIEDLNPIRVVDYLFFQLYSRGETDSFQFPSETPAGNYSIPIEVLEKECIRYFGESIDFTQNGAEVTSTVNEVAPGSYSSCYYWYDEESKRGVSSGSVGNYPTYGDDIYEVQGQYQPDFRLNWVRDYADGSRLACCLYGESYPTEEYFLYEKTDEGYVLKEMEARKLESDLNGAKTYPVEGVQGWNTFVGPDDTVYIYSPQDMTSVKQINYKTREVVWEGSFSSFQPFYSEGKLYFYGDGAVMDSEHKVIRTLDIPENGVFCSDPDQWVTIDDQGITVHNESTGESVLIPGTESYTDPEDELKNTGWRAVAFLGDGNKFLCKKIGYEWAEGFMLYDIAENKGITYDAYSTYATSCILLGDGFYLPFYAFEDGKQGAFVSLKDGSVRYAEEFSGYEEMIGYDSFVKNDRYLLFHHFDYDNYEDGETLLLFDFETKEWTDMGVTLFSQSGESYTLFGVDDNGNGYLCCDSDTVVVVENPLNK